MVVLASVAAGSCVAVGAPGEGAFHEAILPILEENCFDCHGDGADKGGVSFDGFAAGTGVLEASDLWIDVLKNIRSGLMPPARKDRIPEADFARLEEWIKGDALGLDPANPDPGRVTLRRLNRVEYRNTVRDLMGIDYRTDEEFPADDTGYGFDTIGDVLSTSSLLLEKYMQAAESIVARAVPLASHTTPEREIEAHYFNGEGGREGAYTELRVSVYDPLNITAMVDVPVAGTYRVVLDSPVDLSFFFNAGRAEVRWRIDGEAVLEKELKWEGGIRLASSTEVYWEPGKHALQLIMTPLVGIDEVPQESSEGETSVVLRFRGARVIGPLEPDLAIPSPGYARFFPRPEVPGDERGRADYAREILGAFATRAFRRPADAATVDKLVALAAASGGSFENGIARAMTAVLASPRFLFRMEETIPGEAPGAYPLLDEWALASRLSYFLWSTMPDAELVALAERGELREQLSEQIGRMVRDDRSNAFVRNFAGQWLQSRDVESVSIDARIVHARDMGGEQLFRQLSEERARIELALDEAIIAQDAAKEAALREERSALREKRRAFGRVDFGGSLRTAMRREAEMLFEHLLRTDGSVLELIDTDSTFLNEELANHYDVPGVSGREMRLVKLPPGSPRGGVLTMGSVLAVTSNPTRTSPVKRGLFVLDNILGTPPPPPPPDIPLLEASETGADGSVRSLRDALALHREKSLCASCHNRMDPLGLAMENFNAMGRWRDAELGEALGAPSGKLITGETFADVNELKIVLATARRDDYYRCLTEKLLTYALGRGPEPGDITTVDALVESLQESGGRFSTLIHGIIESAPFQRRRRTDS